MQSPADGHCSECRLHRRDPVVAGAPTGRVSPQREVHADEPQRDAYEQARKLIRAGKAVIDERDDWSEHQPTAAEENDFIEEHGWREYAKWHLGIDEEHAEDTKERYAFPYGDFHKVHRCGLLAAESRAGHYKYPDIERAAHELHEMIEARVRV